MPLSLQLLGHFKGDEASETEACQKKRAVRLDRQNFVNVMRRDVLHRGIERLLAIKTVRLQAVHRLLLTQIARYISEHEEVVTMPREAEQGRLEANRVVP
jgi:hypothetical protein